MRRNPQSHIHILNITPYAESVFKPRRDSLIRQPNQVSATSKKIINQYTKRMFIRSFKNAAKPNTLPFTATEIRENR